jgi:RNA polymerase sigma-54 factor
MEQRLIQSPQMIQAMQILQLPALDLAERIEQELTENPFLEVVEAVERDDETRAAEAVVDAPRQDMDPAQVENMLEQLERYDRDFGERRRPKYDDDGDKKLEAMQNTPASPKSLAEALIDELAIVDLDERGREIAEYLIYSFDHRGYLTQPLEEIAAECGSRRDGRRSAARVTELRQLIHPALGARDLREHAAPTRGRRLRRPAAAQPGQTTSTTSPPTACRGSPRHQRDARRDQGRAQSIRTLDPNPGAGYGDVAAAILPDVLVTRSTGGTVRLTARASADAQPALQADVAPGAQSDGVRNGSEAGRGGALVHGCDRAARARAAHRDQDLRAPKDFLDIGVRGLHPLRMRQVADDVGVHISTVSRAVSGKYADSARRSR